MSTLVWLRRDLRLHDHAALHEACRGTEAVHIAFVFDTDILATLPRQDRRVEFILCALQDIEQQLRACGLGLGLIVRHGRAAEEIPKLARELAAQRLVFAHDDDPYALRRDNQVAQALPGVEVRSLRDVTVFERRELLTGTGKPYTVFTPYKNAWLKAVTPARLQALEPDLSRLASSPLATGLPSLQQLGFEPTDLAERFRGGSSQAREQLTEFVAQRMGAYAERRNFPALKGPSYLSPALRFGLVSIRELARAAHLEAAQSEGAQVWLSELIWRDFYHQVLHHHPGVVNGPLKPEYAGIQWHEGPTADAHFEAWCTGQTGYPLVDAAMRQLRQTGYMHNRLRMVAASFLIKHLGLNWQRGEAWFAEQLLDFDLAANNGGWQWAASSGCDAQPWFRIFNPVTQSEKFDADGHFIRRYVPELAALPAAAIHAPWAARPLELNGLKLGIDYPLPIVDHVEARAATLARYGVVKNNTN